MSMIVTRAAAVYALGTFINSCSERTEHANTLDQNIATRLLQKLLENGYPLVRKETGVGGDHAACGQQLPQQLYVVDESYC